MCRDYTVCKSLSALRLLAHLSLWVFLAKQLPFWGWNGGSVCQCAPSKQASTEMETRYQYEGLSGKPSSQVGEVADGESEC